MLIPLKVDVTVSTDRGEPVVIPAGSQVNYYERVVDAGKMYGFSYYKGGSVYHHRETHHKGAPLWL